MHVALYFYVILIESHLGLYYARTLALIVPFPSLAAFAILSVRRLLPLTKKAVTLKHALYSSPYFWSSFEGVSLKTIN